MDLSITTTTAADELLNSLIFHENILQLMYSKLIYTYSSFGDYVAMH